MDEETGFDYAHQRYYWSDLGIFLSVDPLAAKYPGLSPYAYCANNPVMFVDPSGKEYELTFKDQQTKEIFVNTMNKQLEGQFETSLTKKANGAFSLGFNPTKDGGNVSEMSEKGQAFYSEMKKGIDDQNITAKIGIVNGASNVHTGNWITQEIDIADINQFAFNRGQGATQAGKIAHEFVELFEKAKIENQYSGVFGIEALYGQQNSHKIAIGSENIVNGNRRKIKDEENARNIVTQTFYEKNNSISTVNINTRGGVIIVNQTNRKR